MESVMPLVDSTKTTSFTLHGASFTGMASPSRGATENAVWQVTLPPGLPAVRHQLTREEILVALDGCALASIGGETFEVTAGSALIVPADTDFEIRNPGPQAFRAIAILPVGGQAVIGDGAPFTPPWAV
jgi:mannose-6-phosphate isomerase-like protein (cupin superfamily)